MVKEIDGKKYYLREDGSLVPAEIVKPIDSERDDLVDRLIHQALDMSNHMRIWRDKINEQLQAYLDMSLEQWGVKPRGCNGGTSLKSIDGQQKIEIVIAKRITFDEQLQAAKILIDKCIARWSTGASPELVTLVASAFETDKSGKLRTDKILALKKLNIDDNQWLQAMEAIDASITVAGTRQYIRFYQRDDKGKWQQISLDFSSL